MSNLECTKVFFKNLRASEARNEDGTRRYKYIINKGSSRSSKTYSLIDLFDYYARTNSGERYTIWRDTKQDCKATVLSDIKKHHKNTGRWKLNYSFNISESFFEYNHIIDGVNLSTKIEICGTDEENKVHGFTQDKAWINEPYKMSEDTFFQIAMRSNVVYIDYNPKMDGWIDDLMLREDSIVIHSTFLDNPFCPIEQRKEILSRQPISFSESVTKGFITYEYVKSFKDFELLKKSLEQKKLTEKQIKEVCRCWKNEEYRTANAYRWQVYGLGLKAENPNKIYNNWIRISDYEYNKLRDSGLYTRFYGLDFGFSNPTALVEVMYDGDRTLYIKELLYKPEKLFDDTLGNELINAGVPTGSVTYVVCDSQDTQAGSDISKVNDLRTGYSINAVKVSKPSYSDRFSFMKNLIICYTESSKNIEKEYDSYEYKKVNGMQIEEPDKINDHLMNAIEYIAWFLRTYYNIVI